MKKLDKYLVKSFVGPFVAILFIVVFALCLQFLWLYIDELVGKGLSLKVILEFLGWGAATMLPLSMPLATVLASMMTTGALAENSELIAIKSAGISLSRVLAPLTVCGLLIAIGAFFVANNLVPMAFNEIYTLRDDITKTKDEIKIPSKTFYDGIDGYILRVEQTDRKTGMMRGVMVYNHTRRNGNTSLAIADSAMMKMTDSKDYLVFSMYNGINYEETNSTSWQDTTRQIQRTEFSRQEMIIPLDHYEFQKTEVGRYSSQAKAMRLEDLIEDQDSIRNELNYQRQRQIDELRSDRTLEWNKQLDTLWIQSDRPAFALDSLKALPLDADIAAHDQAISRLNSYIAMMTSFDRESAIPAFTKKLVDIEIYKKFAMAVVCFLLFFIGAPLGSIIRKGGLGVPAIVSIMFFVLYYIVDIVGTKLAKDGAIDPFSGAFIATYVMAPICVLLTYKAINDQSVLSGDNIKAWFKTAKRMIMEKIHKTSIVYMGTPDFAVAPLKALLDKGYNVSAVVTVPDKASGRGMQINESPVKKFAVANNIPVLQPVKLKDPDFIEKLKSFKPDIIAVVAFRMLPKEVWSIPRLGTFNLHAALLPQYRGAAPINWAIINGERRSGVTSFLIDEGIDTGTIMMREQHLIQNTDTASDLHDALMEISGRMIVQTVEGLIDGDIDKRVQRSFIQGEEVLHSAPKLTRELCHIDWNDKAGSIVNLIRGLSDYPAAYTELVGEDGKSSMFKIYRAAVADAASPFAALCAEARPAPGTVISDGKSCLGFAAADGIVEVSEIQIAGKKRMSTEDFLRGFRNPEAYTTTQGTSKDVIRTVHAAEK